MKICKRFLYSAELQADGSSGSSFSRGKHYIIYKATDKKGLMASCVFSFTVIGKKYLNCFYTCKDKTKTFGISLEFIIYFISDIYCQQYQELF